MVENRRSGALVEGIMAGSKQHRHLGGAQKTGADLHTVGDRGLIDVVDAQIHFGPAEGVEGTLFAMDALGIRQLIVDEMWGFENGLPRPGLQFEGGAFRPVAILAQEAAARFPDRFAYIQRVVRNDPDLTAHIRSLALSPGCVGLRVIISSRKEREALAAGEWDSVFVLALEHGLPVNLLTVDLPLHARALVGRFPDLRLCADHCGWSESSAGWQSVLDLADLPGITLKWSHPGRTFRHFADPARAEADGLLAAVRAFGADRVCWASDVTYEETAKSWSELLGSVRFHAGLSDQDRDWVLAGTARKLYGLSPECG